MPAGRLHRGLACPTRARTLSPRCSHPRPHPPPPHPPQGAAAAAASNGLAAFTLPTPGPNEPEYLVKWVGRSHAHNEWVPESLLVGFARRKLLNFKKKHSDAPCNFQVRGGWTALALRLVVGVGGHQRSSDSVPKKVQVPKTSCGVLAHAWQP